MSNFKILVDTWPLFRRPCP